MQQYLLLLISFLSLTVNAQTIKVQPYLQQATPNSIIVMWETDSNEESIVEWGLGTDLGNSTNGTAIASNEESRIHEVKLNDLERFTTYFYRVRTGTAVSDIASFKTPPFASDEQSFRLVAMSDMQRDNANPEKFMEIIRDGVLDFIADETDGALIDNLALVMIPGDLVVTGTNYSQWEEHFFDPAQSLFKHVPVYPVLGNHEENTNYYFQYFSLPTNGGEGLEEHAWHHDYGNVRIIGLDSNGAFADEDQLDWLDQVLAQTCEIDDIDFVFAQLHHPHKSELWTPGELDFTGEVISHLEAFSTDCGKPSIHFFGHTHGYSRGQSRDHKHMWINVATAGGAIDNWGEFPNFDYDEFSVSQDEWGFVVVEVEAGEDPHFKVKRVSRGNETNFRDNEVRDSFIVRRNDWELPAPDPIFPIATTVNPACVILQASPWALANPITIHAQSHWQISKNCDDFSNPAIERWHNFENWYFNEDTQAEDDLTDERITNLDENTDYCWRVRYRDAEFNWGDWSEPASFSTTTSNLSTNLLLNPGAENDLFQWTVTTGVAEALTDGECDGIMPHTGKKYFAVGGVCTDGAYGQCVQDVNVNSFAPAIDAGEIEASFGGFLSNYSGNDLPEMRLLFFSEGGSLLDSTDYLSTLNSNWTLLGKLVLVPENTRIIRFELNGTRNVGNDNDSYFDDLYLRLGMPSENCDSFSTSTLNILGESMDVQVQPNPWSDRTFLDLPFPLTPQMNLLVTNSLGQEVECTYTIEENGLRLERGSLSAGAYFFTIINEQKERANGQFIIGSTQK